MELLVINLMDVDRCPLDIEKRAKRLQRRSRRAKGARLRRPSDDVVRCRGGVGIPPRMWLTGATGSTMGPHRQRMLRMRHAALLLMLASFGAGAVVIRDDVQDLQYRMAASEFPALADVPGEG